MVYLLQNPQQSINFPHAISFRRVEQQNVHLTQHKTNQYSWKHINNNIGKTYQMITNYILAQRLVVQQTKLSLLSQTSHLVS